MNARSGALLLCTLVALTGCSRRHGGAGDGDGNAGGGKSLRASGAGGGQAAAGSGVAGGTAGSVSPGLDCVERTRIATQAIRRAVGAALGCSARADCQWVSVETACQSACDVLISRRGKEGVERAVAAQQSGICADFAAAGCQRATSICEPSTMPFACVEGVCRFVDRVDLPDGGPVDAGSALPDAGIAADASTLEPGCLERGLAWGRDGGKVAYRDSFTLEPCSGFHAERTGVGDPDASASCENEVSPDAAITADDVNAALAHADVQAAFAEAPVLYGTDPRPVDGTVLRIAREGAVIEIGVPCSSTPCRQIPEGVSALAEVLQNLATQQFELDGCEALRE